MLRICTAETSEELLHDECDHDLGISQWTTLPLKEYWVVPTIQTKQKAVTAFVFTLWHNFDDHRIVLVKLLSLQT